MIALSLIGLYSFLAEYVICRLQLLLYLLRGVKRFKMLYLMWISITTHEFQEDERCLEQEMKILNVVFGVQEQLCLMEGVLEVILFQQQTQNMQLTMSQTQQRGKAKPLQKSMILEETPYQYSKTQKPTITIQTSGISSLKRSSISVFDTTPRVSNQAGRTDQNQTPLQQKNQFTNLSFSHYYSTEPRRDVQQGQGNSLSAIPSIKHCNSIVQNQNQNLPAVKNSSYGLTENYINFDQQISQKDHSRIISQIIEEIQEKHLNHWITSLKKDVLEEVNKVKNQLQSIRAEWGLEKGMQAAQHRELRSEIIRMVESKHPMNNPAKGKIKKESETSDFQKQVQAVQQKIGSIEARFVDNFDKLFSQISKFQQDLPAKQPKASVFRSALPPIVLQYKQSFVIKNLLKDIRSQQLHLTSQHYYIDKYGYLLDSESHYLLDHHNKQIQLDEKHLLLLQSHNILKR